MAAPYLTLSPPADVAARIHDLGVVAARSSARRALLVAATPAASAWSGPSAVAFTTGRLEAAVAALAALTDGLASLAALLCGVSHALPSLGFPVVSAASPPALVRRMQRELGVVADGEWGPLTSAALRCFQTHRGLPGTGEVDAATARALAAAVAGGAVTLGTPSLWAQLTPRPPLVGLGRVDPLDGRPAGSVPTTGLAAGAPAPPQAAESGAAASPTASTSTVTASGDGYDGDPNSDADPGPDDPEPVDTGPDGGS